MWDLSSLARRRIELCLNFIRFAFFSGVWKRYFKYAFPFCRTVKSKREKREKPSFGIKF